MSKEEDFYNLKEETQKYYRLGKYGWKFNQSEFKLQKKITIIFAPSKHEEANIKDQFFSKLNKMIANIGRLRNCFCSVISMVEQEEKLIIK